jgi:hypothetical protein
MIVKLRRNGPEINVYCDESCHLEHDESNAMSLGAIWCPREKVPEANQRIREIKARHGVRADCEEKWGKVSPSKIDLFLDLVDYFLDDDDLHFRCLLAPDKLSLDHAAHNQTHDDWYYRMYFHMLSQVFDQDHAFNVYVDIKDTHSAEKMERLNEVCCNSIYDFDHRVIRKIQPIRSDEVQLMQLVDILSGAVAFHNRDFPANGGTSIAKKAVVSRIQERTGYSLERSTILREEKFNVFVWRGRD